MDNTIEKYVTNKQITYTYDINIERIKLMIKIVRYIIYVFLFILLVAIIAFFLWDKESK